MFGGFESVKEGLVVRSGGIGIERDRLGSKLGRGESGSHFFSSFFVDGECQRKGKERK